MITIRQGVFETNSSNTHSLSIVSKSKFEKWKNNKEILYDINQEIFLTRNEAIERLRKIYTESIEELKNEDDYIKQYPFYEKEDIVKMKEDYKEYLRLLDFKDEEDLEELNDLIRDEGLHTYESYFEDEDDDYLEYYSQSYTTEKGEELIAFGYFGRDG